MIYERRHLNGCFCLDQPSRCEAIDIKFPFRGNEHVIRLPWCVHSNHGSRWMTTYRDVAEDIGEHLGGYKIVGDTNGHSLIEEFRESHHWLDLVRDATGGRVFHEVMKAVPPLLRTQNSAYWTRRDLLYAVVRDGRWKRRVCGRCGHRFQRGSNDVHDSDYTYLLKSSRYLKIGRAIDPVRRCSDIQTSNPHKVLLLGQLCGGNREDELHQQFADLRVRREWFKYSPEILKVFGVAA